MNCSNDRRAIGSESTQLTVTDASIGGGGVGQTFGWGKRSGGGGVKVKCWGQFCGLEELNMKWSKSPDGRGCMEECWGRGGDCAGGKTFKIKNRPSHHETVSSKQSWKIAF